MSLKFLPQGRGRSLSGVWPLLIQVDCRLLEGRTGILHTLFCLKLAQDSLIHGTNGCGKNLSPCLTVNKLFFLSWLCLYLHHRRMTVLVTISNLNRSYPKWGHSLVQDKDVSAVLGTPDCCIYI